MNKTNDEKEAFDNLPNAEIEKQDKEESESNICQHKNLSSIYGSLDSYSQTYEYNCPDCGVSWRE
jgi:ArsR family metal-binding transcriptional regulator